MVNYKDYYCEKWNHLIPKIGYLEKDAALLVDNILSSGYSSAVLAHISCIVYSRLLAHKVISVQPMHYETEYFVVENDKLEKINYNPNSLDEVTITNRWDELAMNYAFQNNLLDSISEIIEDFINDWNRYTLRLIENNSSHEKLCNPVSKSSIIQNLYELLESVNQVNWIVVNDTCWNAIYDNLSEDYKFNNIPVYFSNNTRISTLALVGYKGNTNFDSSIIIMPNMIAEIDDSIIMDTIYNFYNARNKTKKITGNCGKVVLPNANYGVLRTDMSLFI